MTWPTHQAGALLAALALDLSFPALAAAFMGATLPDIIDQSISRFAPGKRLRQKVFNRIHRGHSHWFGWWLAIFLITLGLPMPGIVRDLLAGLALGALSHVALDMLTPRGVPFLPFGAPCNVAIPLCSTGKWSEYVFLGLILFCGLLCLFSIQPVPGGVMARLRMAL